MEETRDYYENEARRRARPPLRRNRLELRQAFVELLREEGRRSVIDIGAGPGRDGEAFRDAGHRFVGIDLAGGNARLAAERGVDVLQASLLALPIRDASFDAGWTLSTLMHLDAASMARGVDEMVRVLRPGSPLLVGLWGREEEGLVIDEHDLPGRRRPFHLRSVEHNRRLLTDRAELEESSRWERASGELDYQVFRLRVR